ncbi:MAG TPA: hypothetical protein H9772_08800 [Candidatus Oscillibacter pullicola]|nr:hypothetical protein [Candidatus Oscillibacter pullicola]
MSEHPCTLARFLILADGNWRNAVFIESCGTACVMGSPCAGFLFTIDGTGKPVLLPADLFEALSGERIDPAECSSRIRRCDFEGMYRREMLWLCSSSRDCGVSRMAVSQLLPCKNCRQSCPPSF